MTNRCGWVNDDPLYIQYHDHEWGVPLHDDRKLFELLCLEGAQAGLSWYTVLKKRSAYREAFVGFDPVLLASYGEKEAEVLLQNAGIIRNRLKILSVFKNAAAFLNIQKEFGSFDRYLWSFVGDKPIVNHWQTLAEVPAKTALSDALSKDLKKRGFSFVGSTIIYAYMQATGMVNDHLTNCFCHPSLR
ncbi:DNA-3-methyladenine glycosylase I [Gorillibacterium massiliense]|uniref:DNA-3-methyladenine glycosylase I n=1 Tax=Gorillibacterium massiliense TaxID=1280390 RepID=UPI0004ACBBD7|nr:DNA-3-methyladenine glycosylase I [Gorillibacterium massiliense]